MDRRRSAIARSCAWRAASSSAPGFFQEGGAEPAAVGPWLDGIAAAARVPLYPCLRIGAPIEAEPLDLERFEKILAQIAARPVKGLILEGSETRKKKWPRWRDALAKALKR